MKHHATRELFDYWNRLRGSRAAPERAELDLAALRGLIADMFMLKVDAAHLFPFVLSGTRINALACAEQKGCSFLDLWAPSDAQNVAAMLLRAMDASCPVLAHATATPEGWPAHDIEILFLPLGRRSQESARILGLIVPTTAPAWLGLRPATNLALSSLHPIDSSTTRFPFDVHVTAAEVKNSAGPESSDKPAKSGTHLRVFDGGRELT
jgi:hypothetical protein